MKDFELEIPDWREFLVAKIIKLEAMLQESLVQQAKRDLADELIREPDRIHEPLSERLEKIQVRVDKASEEIALKWKAD